MLLLLISLVDLDIAKLINLVWLVICGAKQRNAQINVCNASGFKSNIVVFGISYDSPRALKKFKEKF